MKPMGTAHVYGNDINTDLIIAGKYTKTLDMKELAAHCMEDLDPDFIRKVQAGDWVVAGRNFGCGSSREQAPLALIHSGVQGVLAQSFARIFYRNAINVGLPLVVCDTAGIADGDRLLVDVEKGTATVNDDREISCDRLSPIMQQILQEGGLVPYLKRRGDFDSSDG